MAGVYTVSRVNRYISGMFEQDFALNRISVRGEVSNCKYHGSGHIYFTLKDATSTLAAVLFAGNRGGLSFRLCDGQQVVVTGKIQVYERGGVYQLYAQKIQMDGIGELYQEFERRKALLEEMGMFSAEYKQPIPRFIRTLGVVTAPTGAAVRDIIQITGRRNPYVQILLYPATVQGDGAAESICRGIRALDGRADCIIVGRGGGSIEDLWAFNETEVARAIFDCETPLISAVGHETDFTIADFVADLRAPTPSAAAELAVYESAALREELEEAGRQMGRAFARCAERYRYRLAENKSRLRLLHPARKVQQERQYLADLQQKLEQQMERALTGRRHRLEVAAGRLDGVSPLKRLSGGYAYVENGKKEPVVSVRQVQPQEKLSITVKDGRVYARVCGSTEESHGKTGFH